MASDVVAINELIKCVNIALDTSPVDTCPECDVNGDGKVSIDELIKAVNAALSGCEGGPVRQRHPRPRRGVRRWQQLRR